MNKKIHDYSKIINILENKVIENDLQIKHEVCFEDYLMASWYKAQKQVINDLLLKVKIMEYET